MKPLASTRIVESSPSQGGSQLLEGNSVRGHLTEQLVGVDQRQRGQGRQAGQGQRRIVPAQGREKTLRGDLQADEHQDRKHGGFGHHGVEIAKVTQQARAPHKEPRGQRVGGAAPHGLVRRVSDVGRRLDDPAAEAGDQGRESLDRNHVARVELVAGRRGALRAVDASDHGGQGKGNHDRQVVQRIPESRHPLEPQGRQPLVRQKTFAGIDQLRGLVIQGAGPEHQVINRGTHQQRSQGAGIRPGACNRATRVVRMIARDSIPTSG